mgnify:CR=1 FL=1
MKVHLSWFFVIVALLIAVYIFRDFVADIAFNRSGIIKNYEAQLKEHDKEREALAIEKDKAKEDFLKMQTENNKLAEQNKLSDKRVKILEAQHKEIFAAPDREESDLVSLFNHYGYTPKPVSGLMAFDMKDSNSLYRYRDGYENLSFQNTEKDGQLCSVQEQIYGENGYVPQIENLSGQLLISDKTINTLMEDLGTANTVVIPALKSEVKHQKFGKWLGWGAAALGLGGGAYLAAH